MAGGVGPNVFNMAGKNQKSIFNNLASKAKRIGQDVMYGVRGDYKGYTKELGRRVVKSNMSGAQMTDDMIRKTVQNQAKKNISTDVLKKNVNDKITAKRLDLAKKGFPKANIDYHISGGAFGRGYGDQMLGKTIAEHASVGYRLGNNTIGGYRDTIKSLNKGNGMKKALQDGFTRVADDGTRKLHAGRVAGAVMTASVAGRVATGGGLYRDRYGRINVPGVPFI